MSAVEAYRQAIEDGKAVYFTEDHNFNDFSDDELREIRQLAVDNGVDNDDKSEIDGILLRREIEEDIIAGREDEAIDKFVVGLDFAFFEKYIPDLEILAIKYLRLRLLDTILRNNPNPYISI